MEAELNYSYTASKNEADDNSSQRLIYPGSIVPVDRAEIRHECITG